LLAQAVPFPYTHDLARLITLVRGTKVGWPVQLDAAAKLSDYAVSARYPSTSKAVSPAERREAVTLAKAVFAWAEKRIREVRGG
jgi:HEPN domain-containing protein